jgi:hypothetical protein
MQANARMDDLLISADRYGGVGVGAQQQRCVDLPQGGNAAPADLKSSVSPLATILSELSGNGRCGFDACSRSPFVQPATHINGRLASAANRPGRWRILIIREDLKRAWLR